MPNPLSAKPPVNSDVVQGAMTAIFNWSYTGELDELRTLYAKGLDLQWNAMRDLPWDVGIDREAFARSFNLGGIPIQETTFWHSLSADTRWEIARRGSAFMLSNFLHGEQGALMVAAQLVQAVPHLDGKLYAASQTLDEARHVEVFAAYINKLDHVYPVAPALKELLDRTLTTDNWMMKCVAMQIVVEGLALYTFRDMRDTSEEPLLRKLLTYVSRDEARHTAFGIKYLSAVVPTLSENEVRELEDFAFEAARMLVDSRRGPTLDSAFADLWKSLGIDPADVAKSFRADRDKIAAAVSRRGGRIGPVSGFVIPTLRRLGLYSERIDGCFRDMFQALNVTMPAKDGSGARVSPLDQLVELPEDLDAWVAERRA